MAEAKKKAAVSTAPRLKALYKDVYAKELQATVQIGRASCRERV